MKVLHICNGYLGSNLYKCLFNAQQNIGIENTVYVPINTKSHGDTENLSDNVIVSRCFRNMDRLFFFSKQKKIINDIEMKIDMSQVDVIHAHTLFSGGYAACKLSAKYNIPYVVAVRNTDVNVFFKYMKHLKSVGIGIMGNAKKVIFLSPAYKNTVLSRYAKGKAHKICGRSVVLPNGIDEMFLSNKAVKKTLSKDGINVIYVGQINKNKNVGATIKAIEILKGEGYNIRFDVVGGVANSKYMQMINETEFAHHHPKCPKEEVLEHLARADIFVMPSHYETFGLVYAEAMSQGLPVLYTKGQGFDKQFEDGVVGYAVSDKNPADIAEKIKLAISDYDDISENCVNSVKKFDWKVIAGEYKKIYEELSQ